jgi:hypothetical protein
MQDNRIIWSFIKKKKFSDVLSKKERDNLSSSKYEKGLQNLVS